MDVTPKQVWGGGRTKRLGRRRKRGRDRVTCEL